MTLSILDGIREADLIIADVSHQNPNVLYEMGFAHALRKPTILLFDIKSGSSLPSDLAGLQYITYDPANFRGLADRETLCFVVMPFRPELNYFFLYLKKYLEEKYKIRVERGDSNMLTKELMKKISDQISAASFLIADITGPMRTYSSNSGSHTPRASRSFFSLKTSQKTPRSISANSSLSNMNSAGMKISLRNWIMPFAMCSDRVSILQRCMRWLAISFGSSTPKADSAMIRLRVRSFTPG